MGAATVALRVLAVLLRRITAKSASALILIPKHLKRRGNAAKSNTRAMETAMTAITMRVVPSTAATVALRAWAVLLRRITAKSASALILIPKRRSLNVVKKNTRAMEIAMTAITMRVVPSTAATVALRAWAVL